MKIFKYGKIIHVRLKSNWINIYKGMETLNFNSTLQISRLILKVMKT